MVQLLYLVRATLRHRCRGLMRLCNSEKRSWKSKRSHTSNGITSCSRGGVEGQVLHFASPPSKGLPILPFMSAAWPPPPPPPPQRGGERDAPFFGGGAHPLA